MAADGIVHILGCHSGLRDVFSLKTEEFVKKWCAEAEEKKTKLYLLAMCGCC